MDLASAHTAARALILSLRDGVERLEKAEATQRGAAGAIARDLHQKLLALQRAGAQLDSAWRMAVVRQPPSARDLWKRKVELVSEETDALRAALDKHSHREHRRAADDAARAELLAGRSENYAWAAAADADAAAADSVRSSKRMVQEALATGSAALAAMAGQRDTLKKAQRKALDVVHGLGLSDSLLRLIERRQKVDAALAYGGMAVVTLVVLWAWWHFKR